MTSQRNEPGAFEPRLPQDPVYWSALAERVTASAGPVFAELQASHAWWSPLDRFGPALGIGAVAAAALVLILVGAPSVTPELPGAQPQPTDIAANAFRMPATPDVITLMVIGTEVTP